MSLKKKLILTTSVLVTMLVALVTGLVCLNIKNNTSSVPTNSSGKTVKIEQVNKPRFYTYNPGQVEIVQGDKYSIDFKYVPGIDTASASTVKAYEYLFENNTNETKAVNLKSIDTTLVDVSYNYSSTQLDTDSQITGSTKYELQEIAPGTQKYIYILVAPKNTEIPETFKSSVVWNFGKLGYIDAVDKNGEDCQIKIVDGQELYESALTAPELTEEEIEDGWYFDSWFLDKDFATIATFPLSSQDITIYAKYANLPKDYLAWDSEDECYYVLNYYYSGTAKLPQNLVIPNRYNDGEHGFAYIERIESGQDINGFEIPSPELTDAKTIFIPATIKIIGNYAFREMDQDCKLESVTFALNSQLESLGNNAFAYLKYLTSLDMGGCVKLSSISTLNDLAELKTLKYIKLPSSLSSLPTITSFTGLEIADLSNCNLITTIPASAFTGLSKLVEVKLPNTITAIAEKAFMGCTALTSINVPASVQTMGVDIFNGCTSLTKIDLSNTKLTQLNNRMFRDCSNLVSVKVPNTINRIGSYVFYNCVNLQDMVIPNAVTFIGSNSFQNCGKWNQITFPSGLQTIDNYAFYLSGVTRVDLPGTVTVIGNNAFRECPNLRSVDLTKCSQLTEITTAFIRCPALTTVRLPEGIQSIAASAFQRCRNLNSVLIPSTVTSIGEGAFGSCYALAEVINLSAITMVAGVLDEAQSYVSYFATEIRTNNAPSNIVLIDGIYYYQRGLSDYVAVGMEDINSSTIKFYPLTTEIKSYAFHSCTGLLHVTIPSTINRVGGSAFYQCSNLESLTFEGDGAWYKSSKLNHWINMTNGVLTDVTNPEQNATWFTSTDEYYNRYWYKK